MCLCLYGFGRAREERISCLVWTRPRIEGHEWRAIGDEKDYCESGYYDTENRVSLSLAGALGKLCTTQIIVNSAAEVPTLQ